MNDEIIKVTDLHKSFGNGPARTEVLKGISFTVNRGEFVSIMGPSGCGKSTLLYLIGGLDKPQSGSVALFGRDISELPDSKQSTFRRRKYGFIFQFYNLVPNLTVEENILLPVIMDGKPTSQYRTSLKKLLAIIGMTEKRKAYPNELSGGQQQRVAIARALIMRPKLILADEPTGNLDRKSGEDVLQMFSEINEDLGVTILQVTHSNTVAGYGSRIIRMDDGVIVSDTEIRRNV